MTVSVHSSTRRERTCAFSDGRHMGLLRSSDTFPLISSSCACRQGLARAHSPTMALQVGENLNTSQRGAFQAYQTGVDIVILGSAGAGKSFVTKSILQHAISTRPTGSVVALTISNAQAQEIGGGTLNAFFGTPVLAGDAPLTGTMLNSRVRDSARVRKRVEALSVPGGLLVLDEAFSNASATLQAMVSCCAATGVVPQLVSKSIDARAANSHLDFLKDRICAPANYWRLSPIVYRACSSVGELLSQGYFLITFLASIFSMSNCMQYCSMW